jgi:hypothetical protein
VVAIGAYLRLTLIAYLRLTLIAYLRLTLIAYLRLTLIASVKEAFFSLFVDDESELLQFQL